ncbi:MAG: hypothetical protein WCJ30_00700 [Deltaproteobacteria bacterium]
MIAIAALALVGCPRMARFSVTHPARLNAAPFGNTMTVGYVNGPGEAANVIRSDLQTRIANSLNPNLRLLESAGGLTIGGNVPVYQYVENIERESRTCTRQVANGTNAQGVTQYRTESYGCTYVRRRGQASLQVMLTVTSTADGRVIVAQSYQDSASDSTSAMQSPYESDEPAAIDGSEMLHRITGRVVERFARIILPWPEIVQVRYEDCNGAQACRDGFDQVRQGNPQGAEQSFASVIGLAESSAAPVPPDQVERVSEAFYNRAVTRGYMGHYAESMADFLRATTMAPNERRWVGQLQAVQQLQHEGEELIQQGAVTNATQSVQQAGTP